MLTMTVMQNEREALGQFSTEPTEAKDVLSQLRDLHHTLQECRWRVQVVDHALCAQGDKGRYGLQNQTKYDHSFEIEATKDCSFQNQSKDSTAQNKAEDQHFEKETIDCKKQLKNYGLQSHPSEDQNCQSGYNEDYENLIDENLECQKSAEENDSFIGTTSKDLKLSIHAEDGNIQDLSSDNKKYTDSNTNVSNLSSIALGECSLCDNIEKDIHDETKKETYIKNSFKKCWNYETHSSETIHSKDMTRQECINTIMKEEDRLPQHTDEYLSPIMPPLYNFSDPASSQSNTMTDFNYQQGQLANADVTFLRKQREKKEEQKGDLTLNKNPKKEDASPEQYEKNEKIQSVENIGAAHIDPVPEVAQKIDVIWEALENLRTHFFALHSSLVNTSNIFHSHESLDKSHINSGESDNVHSILEDHISEATLIHRIPCERSLLGTLPFRNHHHCLCQNQISSHAPLKEPVNSATLSGKETRRTYLRYCQDNCLCMVMAVLLLLLFLFLASCLLLMLPVVSVSVRTAGGLPAF